jgi:Subtilase family
MWPRRSHLFRESRTTKTPVPSGMAPHVAGIVAAEDNMLGTIGIAPKATLIGVKVLHGGSGAFGWVIAGILYAPTSST